MHFKAKDLEESSFSSPSGKFGNKYKEIVDVDEVRSPFDLCQVTLSPGQQNFPFHSHGAMWEMYYVLSGTAKMRTDDETATLEAGDTYVCSPGLAHQVINDSDADFVYLVVSNEPPFDACYYPDSDKLLPRSGQKLWKKMPEDRSFWQMEEGAI